MIDPLAGKPVPKERLTDIPALISAYYVLKPDVSVPGQRVAFGTSGHRGCALTKSFNEAHVLAITQAVCEYRKEMGYTGPLYIGIDTHALSIPAQMSAVSVCAANEVHVCIAKNGEFTPTPLVSFAILEHNGKRSEKADGIVITPSHNPPADGGFKYNPPNGGPADTDVTAMIEKRANEILENGLKDVRSIDYEYALTTPFVEMYDFITPYVEALGEIIDIDAIKTSGLKLAADPLGGSALGVYKKIKAHYGLDMEIVNPYVDPTFSFMTLDHDGKIRMDCSSPYAMASLVGLKEKYDLAFGNDTDADRHGIVTPVGGLMNPNHYLSVAIWYLFKRRAWKQELKIGKTLVSSSMIDRVAESLGKDVYEVPVGFKWFVDGLYEGWLGFGGEESAGASFLRFDGSVWSTDKDGIIMNLLAAEIKAKTGRDPVEIYADFEKTFGKAFYARIDAPATPEQKAKLKNLSPEEITTQTLAGETIKSIYTRAPGNGAPIGGLKIVTENGWVAMRPSGTEDIYKIYAESFLSAEHLKAIQDAAQKIVADLFASK
ncbi:phosphoglucomutase (alpha-D-glucose-1,6-bisphosphate-dependent) [Hydrogenimonas cancrithermarum]|uniref:Phosphoglucomutase, alpha-D-glucose phosphate-specific n=1 Tax=Hydrogenimonas cancrithermarum TaxID=2993563 RepID=A0ABN6WSE7_9BACT|nr:phosphoglucomutase (alpha-D-glucose-1,6-bisphosphate-dependent) [Hydrogenimonas cancrithermarum]BDY11731.1 phosphoglucomutase, alpha-D-glucose phosphate-specific [Hydrogenimonas cancrithermarum]